MSTRLSHKALNHEIGSLLSDFDRTLLQLFRDAELEEAREALVRLYHSVSIPHSELVAAADLYSMFYSVYYWMKDNRPLKEAKAVHEEASALLEDMEMAAAKRAKLFPGVASALELLSRGGTKIGIVSTNSEVAIRLSLRTNEVDQFIQFVLGRSNGTTPEQMKPAPGPILRALKRLRCEANQAIYVGDSREDMCAARAAGVDAVGVSTGLTSNGELLRAGAIAVLPSFAHITKLLLVEP